MATTTEKKKIPNSLQEQMGKVPMVTFTQMFLPHSSIKVPNTDLKSFAKHPNVKIHPLT
jgi:hypothetical protein